MLLRHRDPHFRESTREHRRILDAVANKDGDATCFASTSARRPLGSRPCCGRRTRGRPSGTRAAW
ncbi:hypothetical protein [Pseudonocardia zijingensis]|uniref:hypothetical protein n=1 Tax=Pseudonocardia zijingensis TaxID=153376 RepID=UPI00361AD27C